MVLSAIAPGNDRCRCRAEYQIEHKAGKIKILICGKQVKARFTDQTYQILSHQQSKTDQDKYDCADTEVHQVLHDDIAGIRSPL